jgi:hypothetical protein
MATILVHFTTEDGKFGYREGQAVNLEGVSFAVSEIEQKIASTHDGR